MKYTQADADQIAADVRAARNRLAILTNDHSQAKLTGGATYALESGLVAALSTLHHLLDHQLVINAAMARLNTV